MGGGITIGGPRDDSFTNDFLGGEVLSYARFDRALSTSERLHLKHEIKP